MGMLDFLNRGNKQQGSNLQQPQPAPINQGVAQPTVTPATQQMSGAQGNPIQPTQHVQAPQPFFEPAPTSNQQVQPQGTPINQPQQQNSGGGALDTNFFPPDNQTTGIVDTASSIPAAVPNVSLQDNQATESKNETSGSGIHTFQQAKKPGSIQDVNESVMGNEPVNQTQQVPPQAFPKEEAANQPKEAQLSVPTITFNNNQDGSQVAKPQKNEEDADSSEVSLDPKKTNDVKSNQNGGPLDMSTFTVPDLSGFLENTNKNQKDESENKVTEDEEKEYNKNWYQKDEEQKKDGENQSSVQQTQSTFSPTKKEDLKSQPKPKFKTSNDIKILQKIGVAGLYAKDPIYKQALEEILSVFQNNSIRLIFDSESQLGAEIIETLKVIDVKATGIFYKPFDAEFLAEGSASSDSSSNITTFYYSNVLEQQQFFIKEARAFILFNDNTFSTNHLLVNLLFLIDLYKQSAKPIFLVGKGWRGKLESFINDLQINKEVKQYVMLLDNANDIEKVLKEKEASLKTNTFSKAKVIDRRLQGDERDLHIAP